MPTITTMKPLYLECGYCGHFHRAGYSGDCRDNANRFSGNALDAQHGENQWVCVDEETQMEWEVRHDLNGFYLCSKDEAICEDLGHASVGFDGRTHYSSLEDAWRTLAG